MNRMHGAIVIACLAVAACDNRQPQAPARPTQVRGEDQDRLHQLDALNLAIGLKRAIFDSGYTCKRITDAGFVGMYRNLDMWMAHCEYDKAPPRDWAIFVGSDGSVQVRDCKDIPGSGLPQCAIKQRPRGSFKGVE